MFTYAPTSLQYQIDWKIKREPVYRLLDNIEWADNFFRKGEILISCFNKFRNYPDEMQGDKNEGEADIGFENADGSVDLIGYESGLNAFILSTTKSISDQVIFDFNAKCAIKIKHPTLFGLELSKKLPFVDSGLEGSCNYESSRFKYFNKEITEIEKVRKFDFENDRSNSFKLLRQLTMGMELFLKHDKYQHQEEYRFVWFSNQPIQDSIIVHCPEAVRYCEKIVF